MFNTQKKNSFLALAVVAMFMLSAFAVVLAPTDADESGSASYTINMRVGDTFSYTPEANMTDTKFKWSFGTDDNSILSAQGTVHTPADNTIGTTFTFTPMKSGAITATLTANNILGGFNQNVTQTINFVVIDKLAIPDTTIVDSKFTDEITITQNSEANNSIGTYTVSGGNNTAKFSNIAVHVGTTNGSTSTVITASGNNSDTLTIGNNANPTPGTYYVTATVSYSISAVSSGDVSASTASETKDVEIKVVVNNGMVLATSSSNTILADASNGNPISITVQNTDGLSDLSITKASKVSSEDWKTEKDDDYLTAITLTQGIGANINTASITLPTTGFINTDTIADSKDKATIVFNIHATAKNSANGDVSVDMPYTLNVYRNLKFITTPVIQNANFAVSTSSGLDILLTANVSGANKVTYNWGDGTTYTRSITAIDNTFFTANHTYAKAGTYFIQINASNDFDDTTTVIPYTTGDFISFGPSEKKLEVSKIDAKEDGDNMVFSAYVNCNPLTVPTVKWFLTEKDAERGDALVNGEGIAISQTETKYTLTIAKSLLKDDAKITFQASYTFEGDEKATEKESNYVYNDSTTFMQKHGLLFVVFIILAIAVIALTRFGFEFMPYQYVVGLALIILAAIAFFTNDFGLGLWKF